MKSGILSTTIILTVTILTTNLVSATTPIQRAASHGDLEAIQIEIDKGVDVNTYEEGILDNNSTPLMLAVEKGHTDAVNLLISKGADVNICDGDMLTHATPLILAARTGNFEIAKLLIAVDANVNATDFNLDTALMKAIIGCRHRGDCGHKKIIKLLVDNNANVCPKNRLGATAMDFISCLPNMWDIQEDFQNQINKVRSAKTKSARNRKDA